MNDSPVPPEATTRPALSTAASRGAIRRFRAYVRHDAAAVWGITPTLAEAALVVPLAGAPLVLASRLDLRVFRFVTYEDRLLEWLQFAGFATCILFALLAARAAARGGLRFVQVALLLVALASLFIAGEEVSWGQRILGFGTPERLEAINKQSETTVHNVGSLLTVFNFGMLLLGFYGSVVAGFLRTRTGSLALPSRAELLVPPLFLTSAFFVVFVYKLGRFTVIPDRHTSVRIGEWPEAMLALGLSATVILVWRLLRRPSGEQAVVES